MAKRMFAGIIYKAKRGHIHTGSNHVSVFSVGNLIYYLADMLE